MLHRGLCDCIDPIVENTGPDGCTVTALTSSLPPLPPLATIVSDYIRAESELCFVFWLFFYFFVAIIRKEAANTFPCGRTTVRVENEQDLATIIETFGEPLNVSWE